jgi:hypothetical protein
MSPEIALRHYWLLFVAVTCINAAIWWRRGRKEIARNPALEPGYRRLIAWFLIIGNFPWLMVGAKRELPATYIPLSSVEFLHVFEAVIVIYWIAGCYWLFLGRGAEDLAAHPGLLRGDPRNPKTIRIQYLIIIGSLLTIVALQYASGGKDPWEPVARLFF